MGLTVGSLFSGIGGLDLGLERAGMEVIWQSEIDPYACKVLSKHWPEVVNHGNIKEINWQEVERPDVICGGYPCQPFSTAGKRRGEEDPRHLWPWVRTAISELRPRYAILENVRGHLSMGGLSVIGELASIGYDAEWRVVSAASVGANHRRDRIIIVAYPSGKRCMDNGLGIFSGEGRLNALGLSREGSANVADANNSGDGTPGRCTDGNGQAVEQRRQNVALVGACGCSQDVANAEGDRCETGGQSERTEQAHTQPPCSCQYVANSNGSSGQQQQERKVQEPNFGRCSSCQPIPNNERIGDGQHRITANAGQENSGRLFDRGRETGYDGWKWWETEPDVGRVANGVPSRVDRLRGLGNAVVPQVAEVIGRLVISDYQSRED
jgi:DNA (cytosine-5)-methyltransferase 1